MQHPVGFPIVNVHSHYHAGEPLDELKEHARAFGIRWYVMSCLRPVKGVPGNELVRQAMSGHADFIAGLYHLDPDAETPEAVEKADELGFKGVKIIGTLKPYDHDGYYGFYEVIERLGLPVLFHTGFLSVSAEQRGSTVSMLNMRPGMLDTLSRAFPNLKMIGAHLGAPWFEEAACVAIHHPNVYFDLSGGGVRGMSMPFFRRLFAMRDVYHADLRNSLLPPEEETANMHLLAKMMFGTDNPPPDTLVAFTQRLLDGLGATDTVRRKVWGQNAADLFGLPL